MTITEPMPPEVGGVPLPDGAHKLGAYYAGVADLVPRLESDIGWLFLAACGAVSSVSDVPESGLTTHIFRMDPTDYLALKWLTMRSVIPGEEGAVDPGEQCLDARIASIVFNFAAAARLTARVTSLGRVPTFIADSSSWEWDAEPEGPESIPTSVNTDGYGFKIPDLQATALPTQLARITFGNMVTQPQQEFVLGSPYPDDIVSLYRNLTIDVDYKWEDASLYQKLVYNSGTAWSPVVYDTNDGDDGFGVKMTSPANVSGLSNPYSIEIVAERVFWFPVAPPEIAGLNLLRMPIRGIVGRPASGDPFSIKLVNEVASYTWPS